MQGNSLERDKRPLAPAGQVSGAWTHLLALRRRAPGLRRDGLAERDVAVLEDDVAVEDLPRADGGVGFLGIGDEAVEDVATAVGQVGGLAEVGGQVVEYFR